MSKYTEDDLKKELETKEYEYGFYTDIESDTLPVGLNEEIIIAISATLDGQTTAHYLFKLLSKYGNKITRLAHGVPIGGELDYLDEGTIIQAMKGRIKFD